ncbi:MAG: hypothetical protein ACKPBF_07295, partial [Actinomycetota bacterium]
MVELPLALLAITDLDDPRLDPFRWRERRLTGVLQQRTGGPLFIAEGDLVTQRAMEAGCEPVAVLCSEKGEARLATFAADYAKYTYLASEDLRRNITGLGVPLDVISLFKRPEPTDMSTLA